MKEGIINPAFMDIEYLECRADVNFEVDLGSSGTIGKIATWCNLILFIK